MATPEMKAGDRTLSRAAGMVSTAKTDFDRLSRTMSDTIVSYQGKWQGQGGQAFFALHQAWTEKQDRIVRALDRLRGRTDLDREATTSTPTSTQSDNMNKNLGRLDGVKQY